MKSKKLDDRGGWIKALVQRDLRPHAPWQRGSDENTNGPKTEPEPVIDVKTLNAKIEDLTPENDAPQGLRGPTGATVPAPMSGALGKADLSISSA